MRSSQPPFWGSGLHWSSVSCGLSRVLVPAPAAALMGSTPAHKKPGAENHKSDVSNTMYTTVMSATPYVEVACEGL